MLIYIRYKFLLLKFSTFYNTYFNKYFLLLFFTEIPCEEVLNIHRFRNSSELRKTLMKSTFFININDIVAGKLASIAGNLASIAGKLTSWLYTNILTHFLLLKCLFPINRYFNKCVLLFFYRNTMLNIHRFLRKELC